MVNPLISTQCLEQSELILKGRNVMTHDCKVEYLLPGDLIRRGERNYILVTRVWHDPLTLSENGLKASWRAKGLHLDILSPIWFTSFSCQSIIRNGVEMNYDDIICEYAYSLKASAPRVFR